MGATAKMLQKFTLMLQEFQGLKKNLLVVCLSICFFSISILKNQPIPSSFKGD